MTKDDDFKLSRLFIDGHLSSGASLPLDDRASHYLKNVMRRQTGDLIRVFNGKDGEFLAEIAPNGKKSLSIILRSASKVQETSPGHIHLIFAPLRKNRQDMMIEKSVELGADIFHPILTDHGDIRDLNEERMRAQMIEAAEQSERLTIPDVRDMKSIKEVLKNWPAEIPLIAGVERAATKPISAVAEQIRGAHDVAVLVGPVGGFSAAEKELLIAHKGIVPVSLGAEILRAETAAIAMLSFVKFIRLH
jgi:16S rRNA (uracil1498-N3)-methyltransferase